MLGRIGFYGGMANNMYVFAKSLVKIGSDVIFIRDRSDRFAFSQPVWEDVEAFLSYADVRASSGWDWALWSQFEERHGWHRPGWLLDPHEQEAEDDFALPLRGWRHHVRPMQAAPSAKAVLDAMQTCDSLVVCGVEATTLAGLSGKKFIILPHGGDIRIAAGLANLGQDGSWIDRKLGSTPEVLLKQAYAKAHAVVTHGPLRIGGPLDTRKQSFSELMPTVRFDQLPLPVIQRSRPMRIERRKRLAVLCERLGISTPTAELIAFVPSRVDYFWKGQDRLVSALEGYADANRLHLIFSGWGKDYDNLRQRLSTEQATFLPCAMSKQLVYSFFQASDLVIDQFILGHYGTAAQEAMACGAPVMIWIDAADYVDKEPPPVLNVRSPQDIVRLLTDVLVGRIDLEVIGEAGRDWILRHHGPEKVCERLEYLLN